MEKQTLNSSAEKLLLIERDDTNYTPVSAIPDEYLHLLMRYSGAYFYRDEDCDMICQHIKLREFSIWGHDIFARNYIILHPFTPRHILALHYMHEDTIDAVIDHMGPFRLREKQVNLFSLHSDFHTAALDKGKNIFSFHINVAPAALPALAQKFPVLQHLAAHQLDTLNGPVNAAPYQINAVCSQILFHIFNCRYVELQAECLLYRCCIDLYQNFALQDAQFRQPVAPMAAYLHAQLQQLFDYIKPNIGERFTPQDLALKFNIPEEEMLSSFERLFAISLPDYILQQRMMRAYDLLLKSKASLGSIARRTGYPNRVALSRAFQAYYEYDPIAIRNAQ